MSEELKAFLKGGLPALLIGVALILAAIWAGSVAADALGLP